jgi:hypothetical protein
MKKDFGFIDRAIAWMVHLITGVELGREAIHQEQTRTAKIDRRDVSQGPFARNMQGRRFSGPRAA